jgi:hypothetical protein
MKTSQTVVESVVSQLDYRTLAEKTFNSWQYRELIDKDARVSSRVDESNTDHHLLRNIDGSYWARITVWYGNVKKDRMDLPLFTHSLDMARRVRDIVLATLPHAKRLRRPSRTVPGDPRGFFLRDTVAVPDMVREQPAGFIRARDGLRRAR